MENSSIYRDLNFNCNSNENLESPFSIQHFEYITSPLVTVHGHFPGNKWHPLLSIFYTTRITRCPQVAKLKEVCFEECFENMHFSKRGKWVHISSVTHKFEKNNENKGKPSVRPEAGWCDKLDVLKSDPHWNFEINALKPKCHEYAQNTLINSLGHPSVRKRDF